MPSGVLLALLAPLSLQQLLVASATLGVSRAEPCCWSSLCTASPLDKRMNSSSRNHHKAPQVILNVLQDSGNATFPAGEVWSEKGRIFCAEWGWRLTESCVDGRYRKGDTSGDTSVLLITKLFTAPVVRSDFPSLDHG